MRYQEYMDIIRTVNDRFRYYKSIESLFELDPVFRSLEARIASR